MSDVEAKAVRGVFWTVVQAVGGRALSLAVFVVLARLLTPADFGLVAMVGVFIALLEVLVQQGFSAAITQREDLEPAHKSTAFWTNMALGFALGGGLWLAADQVAALYDSPALVPLVGWLALVLPLRAFTSVPVGLLQRAFRFRALAIRTLVGAAAGGIAGVMAALAGWGVYALVVQQLVGGAVDVLAVWTAVSWRPRWEFSLRHLRELLGFSVHLLSASLLDFLNRRSDDFLIGLFLGDVALGLYAVAYRVLQTLTQVLAKTGTVVAFSAFSRMQEEPGRMREAFYRSTQAASVVAMPAFLGMSMLAPIAVPLVFGGQYVESGRVLQVLALIGIVHAVSYYNFAVYVGIGRPDIRLKLLAIHTVVNVGAFLIVVRWGILAVAAAYVVRAYVLIPLDLVALRKLIDVSPGRYFLNLVPALASCVPMAGVIVAAQTQPLPPIAMLALCIPAGALVYALTLKMIAPALFNTLWAQLMSMLARRTAP